MKHQIDEHDAYVKLTDVKKAIREMIEREDRNCAFYCAVNSIDGEPEPDHVKTRKATSQYVHDVLVSAYHHMNEVPRHKI